VLVEPVAIQDRPLAQVVPTAFLPVLLQLVVVVVVP
jgi:hypothetical protein